MASFNLKRFIKNPAKGLKNAGKSIGKAMDNPIVKGAGALALGATGVGAPLSAAIMAGNSVTSKALQGKSVPKALPGIAIDAGTALAMAKGGDVLRGLTGRGAIKLPAHVDVGKIFPGLPTDAAGNIIKGGAGGGGGGWWDTAGRMISTAAGAKQKQGGNDGWLDGLSSVRKKLGLPAITAGNVLKGAAGGVGGALSYAKNNPMDIALLGLAGASGVGAVNATKRANSLADSALDRTRAEYAARAPMRAKGMEGAMNPARPDLTDIFTWQSKPRPIRPAAPVAPTTPADVRPSIPGTPPAGALPALPALPSPWKRKLLPPGSPVAPMPTVPDARLLKRKGGPIPFNALVQ